MDDLEWVIAAMKTFCDGVEVAADIFGTLAFVGMISVFAMAFMHDYRRGALLFQARSYL